MSEGYKKILVHISCNKVETVEIEVPDEYSEDDIRDKAWDVAYNYEGSYDVAWEDLTYE